MANIRYSAIVADAAGSVGGVTLSRGKGGAVARTRRKGVNNRSTTQNARRAVAAYLAKYWSNTLTEQQRSDWRAYAAGTAWTNKLGDAIEITGNAAFMQLNTREHIFSDTVIAEAPLAMGHAGGVTFSFAAENDTSKIQMNEPGGAFDKDTDIHTLLFFQGLPSQPGRVGQPKGYKYIGRVWGSSGAPLAFPYELDSAYTMQAGQLVNVKVVFHDEFYRSSGPFFGQATAAPSI